jgi:hypothetical protein
MSQSQSLLDFLHGLISDGALRARFSADPASALAGGGVVGTSPQEVYDTLVRIGDDQDLAQGFDRGFDGGRARSADILHVPPPPPPEYFGERDAHAAAVHYLDNYVSSSFDDDLGPFTGSSAEHAVDDGAAEDQFGDPATADGHDFDAGHDYSAHDSDAHDPTHHGGFDAGGL